MTEEEEGRGGEKIRATLGREGKGKERVIYAHLIGFGDRITFTM